MARITFPDGRWVDLRPMYVDDELAIHDLGIAGEALEEARAELVAFQPALEAANGTPEQEAVMEQAMAKLETVQREYHAQMRRARDAMQDAVVATSWDGPLGKRVTSTELGGLVREWRTATEDDAIPPDSGASS